jgi:hypothetical protein
MLIAKRNESSIIRNAMSINHVSTVPQQSHVPPLFSTPAPSKTEGKQRGFINIKIQRSSVVVVSHDACTYDPQAGPDCPFKYLLYADMPSTLYSSSSSLSCPSVVSILGVRIDAGWAVAASCAPCPFAVNMTRRFCR